MKFLNPFASIALTKAEKLADVWCERMDFGAQLFDGIGSAKGNRTPI